MGAVFVDKMKQILLQSTDEHYKFSTHANVNRGGLSISNLKKLFINFRAIFTCQSKWRFGKWGNITIDERRNSENASRVGKATKVITDDNYL